MLIATVSLVAVKSKIQETRYVWRSVKWPPHSGNQIPRKYAPLPLISKCSAGDPLVIASRVTNHNRNPNTSLGSLTPSSGPILKGLRLCQPDLDYRLIILRAPHPGEPRGCHVAPFPRLYSRRYSRPRSSSGFWAPWALRGGFFVGHLRVSEEGSPRVHWGCLRRVFRGSFEGVWGGFYEGPRGADGIRGWAASVASRLSTRASKLLVTQLVFVARGAFPRSTPCVCAVRVFLPGRVFRDRTTRRHGLARPSPNWVGWAECVVTFEGAAGKEGNSTFLEVVAVRHPASEGI